MLHLIGLGLWNIKDISVAGFEKVKSADIVYLETYTSIFGASIKELETFFGKTIISADRKMIEQDAEKLLADARRKNVALLVYGDPLCATTHVDLLQRAAKDNIKVEIFQNASILNAIARTGLQAYKFGKTSSIPFSQGDYQPETPYLILKENLSISAHTLFLLDLRPDENKFMSIADGLRELQRMEIKQGKGLVKDSTVVIACARLGASDQLIKAGTVRELLKTDFGKPPHCIILPGKLHFVEEEWLKKWSE
ncbi:MAG: diphthine synthase [Candidatus Woesearchaeota archaeon]|nr:diphthine synthase [Candidatus Woesearchaeota archaeon]